MQETLEDRIKAAAELIRADRPHWSVTSTTEEAIVDRDEVTEDRRTVHSKPPEAVKTEPGGDGFKDSNPDTGAGSLPGRLVLSVNEHRFDEAALAAVADGGARRIADFVIGLAGKTAPSAPKTGQN